MDPRTPPALNTTTVTIQELATITRPPVQVESNVASSSALLAIEWQSIFTLGDKPLLMTSSVRNWATGEGGRIARSLG